MTVLLPAHLSDMINNLGKAAKDLAEEVRADRAQREADMAEDRRQRRRESRQQTALLIIVGLLVAALAGLSVGNRLLGNQNRSVIESIESCTDPEGECAKRGQQRTAEAIGTLIRMDIEVAWCARTSPTEKAYRECVDVALADVMGTPRPGTTVPVPLPSATR
jgi:hypothetical protein